jgi:DNA-3-methyladenine glycosylase I
MSNLKRCDWADNDPLLSDYHDREWGVPVYDDRKIFEFLILESFQAGLSWMTILRKRGYFRKAFDNFDFELVAKYGQEKIDELMNNSGIIRNKMKIEAAINNAKAFIRIRQEFDSFSNYIWSFTGGKPIVNNYGSVKDLPAKTELSDNISKDLKKRGFKFMGSTIIYSHMQATGIVNDHYIYCFRHKELS